MTRFGQRTVEKRNQSVIILTIFITLVGLDFVAPFLPLYVRELGETDPRRAAWWAGLIAGSSPLFSSIGSPIWGQLADRYGYKPMVQRSIVVIVVVILLMYRADQPWQLMMLWSAHGLLGGFGALSATLATVSVPRDGISQAMSAVQSSRILASAVGPIVGGILASIIGLRATFLIAAVLCAFGFALIRWGYHRTTEHEQPTYLEPWPAWRILISVPALGVALVVLFAIRALNTGLSPVLPLYLVTFNLGSLDITSMTGLALGIIAGTSALAALVAGKWTMRYSDARLLVVTLMAAAICSLFLFFSTQTTTLFLSLSLLGLFTGGALTLIYTIGARVVPDGYHGIGIGLLTSAAKLGDATGPIIAGNIASIDLRQVFVVSSGGYMAVALSILLLRGRRVWSTIKITKAD